MSDSPTQNIHQPTDTYALMIYLGGIIVTVCAMVLAVILAGQRPTLVVLNSTAGAASVAPAGMVTPPGPVAVPVAPAPAESAPQIDVRRVDTLPPIDSLFDPAWERATVTEVALLPQNIARPMLDKATVTNLQVQALRDSQRIAWRVSWDAPEPSANVDVSHFSDAVALQFGLAPDTPFMMGGPGKPVRILHWKALWQKDQDEGFQDVQSLHPNFVNDFYWFAKGQHPFPVRESFSDPAARSFHTALEAGNPMSDQQRATPVEELTAEGFGTATNIKDSPSSACGQWKDGRWTVVIDRPLAAGDPLAAAIEAGSTDTIAFAVWDGSAQNVGGRKHFSNWISMRLGQ